MPKNRLTQDLSPSRARRGLSALIAVAACCLSVPAFSYADTVVGVRSSSDAPELYVIDQGPEGTPPVSNRISIRIEGPRTISGTKDRLFETIVTDANPLVPEAPCRYEYSESSPNVVNCPTINRAPSRAFLDLGRGADSTDIGSDAAATWALPLPATVLGGPGADVLEGSEGADVLTGGDARDVAAGGPGNDVISGGLGDDRLIGGKGDDQLTGGDGADEVNGNAGHDVLAGGLGEDELFGHGGNDVFHALDGVLDQLSCGAGQDDVSDRDAIDTLTDTRACETKPTKP